MVRTGSYLSATLVYDAWILILYTLFIIFYIAWTTPLTQITPGINLNMLHYSLKVKSSNLLSYRKKYLRVWLPQPIPSFFCSPFSATTGQHFCEFLCSNQPSPVPFVPLFLLSLIPCLHGNWGYPCTTWFLAQSRVFWQQTLNQNTSCSRYIVSRSQ